MGVSPRRALRERGVLIGGKFEIVNCKLEMDPSCLRTSWVIRENEDNELTWSYYIMLVGIFSEVAIPAVDEHGDDP